MDDWRSVPGAPVTEFRREMPEHQYIYVSKPAERGLDIYTLMTLSSAVESGTDYSFAEGRKKQDIHPSPNRSGQP